MSALKIMVVDDSLLTQKKLIAAIEDLGHTVISVANSGAQALVNYAQHKPDLVTMDITMPDMDGITATRAILDKYPDAKILMVTLHAERTVVLDALDAGAKGYILKPFEAMKLRKAIGRTTIEAGY